LATNLFLSILLCLRCSVLFSAVVISFVVHYFFFLYLASLSCREFAQHFWCERGVQEIVDVGSSQHIGQILPTTEPSLRSRDIVVRPRGDYLIRITECHPAFLDFHFPILFPIGQLSWSPSLCVQGSSERARESALCRTVQRSRRVAHPVHHAHANQYLCCDINGSICTNTATVYCTVPSQINLCHAKCHAHVLLKGRPKGPSRNC
jgi:hypothetical protein